MCSICGHCLGVGSFQRSKMIAAEDKAESYNNICIGCENNQKSTYAGKNLKYGRIIDKLCCRSFYT